MRSKKRSLCGEVLGMHKGIKCVVVLSKEAPGIR